ncbi:hypothetical protein T484DRAFT_3262683 [Baffinella frigidus]|nr:hypothetical protein T484DRAFT_3262683 [Cryptophyta sp. CCMP2293]
MPASILVLAWFAPCVFYIKERFAIDNLQATELTKAAKRGVSEAGERIAGRTGAYRKVCGLSTENPFVARCVDGRGRTSRIYSEGTRDGKVVSWKEGEGGRGGGWRGGGA